MEIESGAVAFAAGLAGIACSLLAPATLGFEIDGTDSERLRRGEVIVRAMPETGGNRGWINAAVWIDAEATVVWSVMTDCSSAPAFVPGLKRCAVLERAADGGWEVIEHEVKYSVLLPRMRYVFRAAYRPSERIDFKHLRGDFERNEGSWELSPLAHGGGTLVKYSVFVDPRFHVPRWLIRRSLEDSLRELMAALRDRVMATRVR